MSKRDEIKEQLRNILSEELITYTGITVSISQAYINKLIDQILALEGLAIVDREAKLPDPTYGSDYNLLFSGYRQAQQDMTEQGWVKEVKDGS